MIDGDWGGIFPAGLGRAEWQVITDGKAGCEAGKRACPPFIATTARCTHVAYTDGADVTSDDR